MLKKRLWFYALLGLLLAAAAGVSYWRYLDEDSIALVPQLEYSDLPEHTEGHHPVVCSAFIRPLDRFGMIHADCPEGHAYFGNSDEGVLERKTGGDYAPVVSVCCKLPADDILTDEHLIGVREACPYNYVATGGSSDSCGRDCTMRCTRINTERYRLGEERQAFYWKQAGTYPSAGRGAARQIMWHRIPAGIRYAQGAEAHNFWQNDGCIGIPFGSLLVRKTSFRCDGYFYRPLLFRDGTPVRMFPDCTEIAGFDTKEPRCID